MEMGIGTGIGQKQRLSIRLSLPCGVCGWDEGRAPNCLMEVDKQLSLLNRYIHCPTCDEGGENGIGLNSNDLYECRSCHTQYCRRSTSNCGGCVGEEVLDDPKLDDICVVCVLKEKGNGDFPIDKSMKEIREQIKRILALRHKQRNKPTK